MGPRHFTYPSVREIGGAAWSRTVDERPAPVQPRSQRDLVIASLLRCPERADHFERSSGKP